MVALFQPQDADLPARRPVKGHAYFRADVPKAATRLLAIASTMGSAKTDVQVVTIGTGQPVR